MQVNFNYLKSAPNDNCERVWNIARTWNPGYVLPNCEKLSTVTYQKKYVSKKYKARAKICQSLIKLTIVEILIFYQIQFPIPEILGIFVANLVKKNKYWNFLNILKNDWRFITFWSFIFLLLYNVNVKISFTVWILTGWLVVLIFSDFVKKQWILIVVW